MPARRSEAPIRILSWNVNGLRACAKKGFALWLERSGAEVVGIQEVRAEREQIPAELSQPEHWHASFSAAERKGYSGVGLYARRAPDRIDTALGEPRFDSEGRFQIARFGRLAIANIYFPNGNGKDRDNSRVPYKLDFYSRLFERLQRLRRSGARVLVMGDFNTAHREIDLARPKQLDRCGLDRHLSTLRSVSGSIHLVESALRSPRQERRLADRLRAGLPSGDEIRQEGHDLFRCPGIRSLPDRRGGRSGDLSLMV